MTRETEILLDSNNITVTEQSVLFVDFSISDIKHLRIKEGTLVAIDHNGDVIKIVGFVDAINLDIVETIVFSDKTQVPADEFLKAVLDTKTLTDDENNSEGLDTTEDLDTISTEAGDIHRSSTTTSSRSKQYEPTELGNETNLKPEGTLSNKFNLNVADQDDRTPSPSNQVDADAPYLNVQNSIGDEDTAISLNIAAALTDQTEVLTITIKGVPDGAILSAGTNNWDGSWSLRPENLDGLTITPAPNDSNDFTLTIEAISRDVTDLEKSSATLDVAVTAVADAPTLAVSNTTGDEDTAIDLDITAGLTDSSEILSVVVSGVPTGAVLSAGSDNGDGSWTLTSGDLSGLTITPSTDDSSDFTLTIAAKSQDGADIATTTDTIDVAVTAVADAPTLAVSNTTGDEDTAIDLDITAGLTDSSEILSVVVSGVPTGAALSAGNDNGDGSWTLTSGDLSGLTITPPTDDSSDFTLTIAAKSQDGADIATTTDTIDVAVTAVADAPTLAVSDTAGDEDTAIDLDITAGLTDSSEILSVVVSGVPTGAVLSAGNDNGDGSWTLVNADLTGLTITPPTDDSSDFTLTIAAKSQDGADIATTTDTIDVAVTAVADAPTLAVSDTAGDEDTAIDLDITAGLTDSSEILSVVVSGVPTGATLSAGSDNGDGSWTLVNADLAGLTITPPTDDNSDFSLNVAAIAKDGADITTATNTVAVTVTAVDDAPIVSSLTLDGSEDTTLTITQADLLASATDVDGQNMTVTNLVADGGNLTDNGDGTWDFTPDENFNGDINIAFDVSDGAFTIPATGVIDVAAVNDAATFGHNFADLDATFAQGYTSSTSIADMGLETDSNVFIMSFDTVSDVSSAQTLFETGGGGTGLNVVIQNGELQVWVGSGNNLELSTPINADTSYNFVMEVNKGDNTLKLLLSDTHSLAQMNEDNSLADSKDNWTDTDWDGGDNMAIGNGSGSQQGGIKGEFQGTISAPGLKVYADSEIADVFDNKTVLETQEDQSLTITQAELLTLAHDVEGDSLSVQNLSVNGGALVDNGDGTWGFTPDTNFKGSLNASFDLFDGTDITPVQGLIEITVTAVADAPTLSVGDAAGDEDTAIALTIAASLTDSSELLSIMISGVPTGAVLSAGSDNGDGSWTLANADLAGLTVTPPADDNSNFSLTITAKSQDGVDIASTVDTIDVAVAAVAEEVMDYSNNNSAMTIDFNTGVVSNGNGTSTLEDSVTSVVGSLHADKITGNSDDNIIASGSGKDKVYGGGGDDTISGGNDSDKLYGDDGDDTISGDDGNDRLIGGDGNDILNGGTGNDSLYGQNDDDVISGGDGKDKLYGQNGDDVLKGGSGNDVLSGGAGDDVISGGSGKNKIDGGSGEDTVDYSDADNAVTIDFSKGTVKDSDGNNVISDKVKNVENATGSDFDDTISGDKNDNVINGGKGSDNLSGGGGSDIFVLSDDDGGIDVISDFDFSSGDRVDVSALVDIGEGENIDDHINIVESDGNTHIQIDTDGASGGSSSHDVAIIQGVVGLDISSIIATDDNNGENG